MDKLSLRIILTGAIGRLVNGLRTTRVPPYTTYSLSVPEDQVSTFGDMPSLITELWWANKTAMQYTYRLERLVQHLRDAYDAWLYRTWLMSLIDSLPDIDPLVAPGARP